MTALKGLQMTGRISYCQRPPNINSLWRVDRLNLHGKSTVKNKYLKIMQTRATPALELPCIWTIYKLKNTDSLFCSFYVFFSSFFSPPEMSLPLCNQPINIQPLRQGSLPHIADMARTIKAVLKTFSHWWENKSQNQNRVKDSQAKNNKKKKKNMRKTSSGEVLQYKPKGCICLIWIFCLFNPPLCC